MAMEALQKLTDSVPGWLKDLTDLSGQIDRRQAELAAVAAAEGTKPKTKSLRNKGSTESLRLRDDIPTNSAWEASLDDTIVATEPPTPPTEAKKSSLMVSAEGAPAAYRTRNRVTVYYDGDVQGFFDNLVKFVLSCEDLIRKARVAARIAQIKRLAEADMAEGKEDGDDDSPPLLRCMSTRLGYGPTRANDQPLGVYDRLNKSLGIVQNMCKHGAHQFLRDGDCNDEISEVRKHLTEVLEVATEEMERVRREEPELSKETDGLGKLRVYRPSRMRRKAGMVEAAKTEDRSPSHTDTEVLLQAGEDIDIGMELPKLQDQSTRAVRDRGP